MAKITTQTGQDWKLQVTQAGTATLQTSGKVLDRNIKVEVPEAQYTINAEANEKGTVNPKVAVGIESGDKSISKITVSSAPETGDYYVITPSMSVVTKGSATASVDGEAVVDTAGFVSEGQTISGQDLTIGNISADVSGTIESLYLPVKSLSEDNINAATEHLSGVDAEGDVSQDNLTVSLSIPAGYYEAQTISKTFTDLLENIDDDASAEYILYGMNAYDEDGNKLTGTMANHSADKPSIHQEGKGVSYLSNTNGSLTLSATNNASGLDITGYGSVEAYAQIDGTGYYTKNSVSDVTEYSSESTTKYITDLALAEGKTLNSLSNGGTITSLTNTGSIAVLNGSGEIEELAGSQTVNKLTGTITIVDAFDVDGDVEDTEGKVIFGDTTIVKDGKLIESKSSKNGDTITFSEGWISSPTSVGVDSGEYKVECTQVAPSIEYTSNTDLATTTTPNDFAITFGGTVTSGSHKATATVTTAGYLETGAIHTTEEEISVSGANEEGTIYLAAAGFGQGFSEDKFDGTDVPMTYDFKVSAPGYTIAGVKESIDVFDGEFSWS